MKQTFNRILVLLMFLTVSTAVCALANETSNRSEAPPPFEPFITTWKTDNYGPSCNSCITIPTGTGTFNYDVDWNNDGIFDELGISGDVTHDFGTPGTYTIQIQGYFPHLFLGRALATTDHDKIVSIDQWGDIEWGSMYKAFYEAQNLIYNASDLPNLSGVTNMSYMFYNASLFNGNIGSWDVSNVTDMSGMFYEASQFNGNIGAWEVSNVTDMTRMFWGASNFNQDIGTWEVSNVTTMYGMFYHAYDFNQDIGAWDVSNVTTMRFMFDNAIAFNQDIGSWEVSNVTNMSYMFYYASLFNGNIGSWEVSNVTTMERMFYAASNFNQNIGAWEVANVTNMGHMFYGASNFNQNIGAWEVSNVTNMSYMFAAASNFNQNIGAWEVSNVTNMGHMFYGASNFNQNIGAWEVANVTNMYAMFAAASNFNQNIGAWEVSNVTNMSYMFYHASLFNGNIGSWEVSNVTDMERMFYAASNFNQNIGAWEVANVTNMYAMFAAASNFNQNIGSWEVSNVTTMVSMFYNASAFNQDISSWDVSNVNNMAAMLLGTDNFDQNLAAWNITNVYDMYNMLNGSGMSTQSYDNTLIGWAGQAVQTGVKLGAIDLEYCLGESARETLISTYSWTITGDTYDCTGLNSPPVAQCHNLTKEADINCEAHAIAEEFDDGSTDPDLDPLTFSVFPEGPYPKGATTVTLTVEDDHEGVSTCTSIITVEDNAPPVAHCLTTTIEITPDGTYDLVESDVFDAITSHDNCGIAIVNFPPTTFACVDHDMTFVVPVTVYDEAGNNSSCDANITVALSGDLPGSWSTADIGSAPTGNDYSFDPCVTPTPETGEFTVSGSGNNTSSTTTDNIAFASQTLCGNGSITAKIEYVEPNGYGGLMIRESFDAGSKQVSVFSNMTNSLRHESRFMTNGMKTVNNFMKPSPIWLRLDRMGDWVFSYYSSDGINFQYVHGAYVPMTECVEIGMASFTYLPATQTDAIFSNVSTTGDVSALASTPPIKVENRVRAVLQDFTLFPNPNTGQFSLRFEAPVEQSCTMEIYSMTGGLVQQQNIQPGTLHLDINLNKGRIESGSYLLRVRREGLPDVIKVVQIVE